MKILRLLYNKIKFKIVYRCTKAFLHSLYISYTARYNQMNRDLYHQAYGTRDYIRLNASMKHISKALQSIDELRILLGDPMYRTEPISKAKAEYLQTILLELDEIEESVNSNK